MQEFECDCQKQPLTIKVVESFIAKDGKSRTRKRYCKKCFRQYITKEVVEFKLPKRMPKK